MRVLVFLNGLGPGGTEKAACRWAEGLVERGHCVQVISLADGPRREGLVAAGIRTAIAKRSNRICELIREAAPEVIHAHCPGFAHPGDILGECLRSGPKIPVLQTNVFGRLENPAEDRWTDFRLFISWTSCVQAAIRSGQILNSHFFQRASVAAYPLDANNGPDVREVSEFRRTIGVAGDEILYGRFSRPEPNKWTDLPLRAFRRAATLNPKLKLLLREAPTSVVDDLRSSRDRNRFITLPLSIASSELHLSMAACDVILHTSSIGESFGYGIAEPMNFGIPVITHSTPWADQAQIELVRHGECGLVASTAVEMSEAILDLAADLRARRRMGERAQHHIRKLADPSVSISRVEAGLTAALRGIRNPFAAKDLQQAEDAASYLKTEQFGHAFGETLYLRGTNLILKLRSLLGSFKQKWIRA